jgi:hypothetical protein
MPAKKPKKTYRTLQEPATHGRFDRGKIRRVVKELLKEGIKAKKEVPQVNIDPAYDYKKARERKSMNDLTEIIKKLPKLGKDAEQFLKDIGNVKKLAGKYKGPKYLSGEHDDYLTKDSRQAAYVEIPDDEVIETGGDIIIIPASNRPRAYKRLLALATKVIGDKELATLWLYETQFGLDDARPVDHMRTAKGAKEVESLLLRLEYGDCL